MKRQKKEERQGFETGGRGVGRGKMVRKMVSRDVGRHLCQLFGTLLQKTGPLVLYLPKRVWNLFGSS